MGLLRFAGMLNVAIWLGAAVFCVTALPAALNSREVVGLVGERYAELISGSLSQIIITRLYYLQIVCAIFAGIHVLAERLYSGRVPRRIWLVWLALLAAASVVISAWALPQVNRWQRQQYSSQVTPEDRSLAQQRYRLWHGLLQFLNAGMIVGISVYFWRVSHPENQPRFVSPMKFRS
jgi:hypothetical protein